MFDHYYKGVAYSRPEFVYFWIYYFLINFIWAIFPSSKFPLGRCCATTDEMLVLLYSSVTTTARAFKALEEKTTRADGKSVTSRKNI